MKEEEIRQKAAEAFFKFRIRKTDEGTGILIYVSIFEHMIWVVGDDAINEKIGADAWHQIRDLVQGGFRRSRPEDGLKAGIERCGELLAEHFPIREGDVNELSNEIRILD